LVDLLEGKKLNGSSDSLRERLTWKIIYKCTMQILKNRNPSLIVQSTYLIS
jgi:hypothetical protein